MGKTQRSIGAGYNETHLSIRVYTRSCNEPGNAAVHSVSSDAQKLFSAKRCERRMQRKEKRYESSSAAAARFRRFPSRRRERAERGERINFPREPWNSAQLTIECEFYGPLADTSRQKSRFSTVFPRATISDAVGKLGG